MMNRHWRIGAGVALLAAGLGGCVERKITVGSDPPGAVLWLNDQEVGRTPISVPFTWYGDYDIRLRYEKNTGTATQPSVTRYYLHTHKETKIPWFETIGVDFFAEVLPFKFQDNQVWAFVLPEVQEPTQEELIQRANELKDRMAPPK